MGEAAARTSREQAQDQPGLLGRAAIVLGVDAEGAMEAVQARGLCFQGLEARIPHQRAVGKNPEWFLRAHAWLRWISARRMSRVRVKSSNSLSPSPQRMARC